MALQKTTSFTFENTPTEVGSANNFMFDYPASHEISKFEMKDPSGNWADFSADYNKKAAEITKTIHGVDHAYYRLTTAGGNGPMTYRITLNKTLDQ